MPRAVVGIGAGLLCFGTLLAYDFVGLSGSNGPSAALLGLVVGSGFALTCGGVIAATFHIKKERRKTLSFSLLAAGIAALAVALFVAHVGPVLLVLAIPAIVLGVIVGIMALPTPRLHSKRRLQ